MELNKIWGIILILLGVGASILGVTGIMEIQEYNSQVGSANNMFGGLLSVAKESYARPTMFLIGGLIACVVGSVLFKKEAAQG